jgi:hypothetical protein
MGERIIPRTSQPLEMIDPVDEVARRLRRFDETQNPAELWPGLTDAQRIRAAREIERVTRRVLAGDRGVRIDHDGAHEARALAIAGHTSGMGPLIGRWAEDGLVLGAPDVVAGFARHLEHARRRAVRMEAGTLPLLDALAHRGIRPLVLKGAHTARVYFEEPGVRRMNDVDLLVPLGSVADAEAALREARFVAASAALRPYKRDWIGGDVDPRLHSVEWSDARSRWMIELHASLDRAFEPGVVARLDGERHDVVPLDIAGRRVDALAPAPLLVTLACHCSQELDGSRLLRLVEMVRVIRVEQKAGRFAWDDVLALLARTDTARFTYPALALVERLAPGTIDARVLALGARTSTWAARHTVERLVPAGSSLDDRGIVRQLMWTRGPVGVGARVLRNVWPASFSRPGDVLRGWRIRLRRLRSGAMSLAAPDEREG